LILKKISKIGATRSQILRLKCTKINFGGAPDPAGGAYSAPPDHLAVFKGPTSRGKEGKGEERRGREGEGKAKRGGRRRKGKEGEERTTYTHPLSQIPGYATANASTLPVSCHNSFRRILIHQ